jgi:proteasome beta subunit
MSLYLFPHGDDPGSNFVDLLRRTAPPEVRTAASTGGGAGGGRPGLQVPHATTIAAVRFAGGVVMAGDRRVTMGHAIAHRAIEKVFPADRYSAVAIAGAAGIAIEMVRLFQTQLEHYEKVEGAVLSLEGKANQLGQMVRANLGMAMEGLVVVPLFAGYDTRRRTGRIFTYDVTGGRYEETDFHATGSGGPDARHTIKAGYRDDLPRDEAVELLVRALYEAADEDSATGGPDPLRGIYPVVATVDAKGFSRVAEAEVAEHFQAVIDRLVAPRHAPREQAPVAGGAAPEGGDTPARKPRTGRKPS